MKSMIWIMIPFIISGCCSKELNVVCNKMPQPSKNTLIKLKKLNDKEVDKFMKNLLILKLQLKKDCEFEKK